MSNFSTWNDLIRRWSVAVGSVTALVTLLQPAPVSVACLRGGVAWVAMRLGGWAIGWTLRKIDELEGQAAAKLALYQSEEGESQEGIDG